MISGKFSNHSRDELKELIEIHGGRNLAAVSANVDYIVAGENMGPAKLKKAEKLGVKIISEEDFIAMIGSDEIPAANAAEKRTEGRWKGARRTRMRPSRSCFSRQTQPDRPSPPVRRNGGGNGRDDSGGS